MNRRELLKSAAGAVAAATGAQELAADVTVFPGVPVADTIGCLLPVTGEFIPAKAPVCLEWAGDETRPRLWRMCERDFSHDENEHE